MRSRKNTNADANSAGIRIEAVGDVWPELSVVVLFVNARSKIYVLVFIVSSGKAIDTSD